MLQGIALETTRPQLREAISEGTASTLTSMLQSVMDGGTGYPARAAGFTAPAAGKTGTTSDYTDAWFVGYTPQLVAGVWVGFDRRARLGEGMTGARAALPAWTQFMLSAGTLLPATAFPQASEVLTRLVCPVSGALARSGCPEPLSQTFVGGEEPADLCTVHDGEAVEQPNGAEPIAPPATDDEHDTQAPTEAAKEAGSMGVPRGTPVQVPVQAPVRTAPPPSGKTREPLTAPSPKKR